MGLHFLQSFRTGASPSGLVSHLGQLFVERVLTLCRYAVSVFYRPSLLSYPGHSLRGRGDYHLAYLVLLVPKLAVVIPVTRE